MIKKLLAALLALFFAAAAFAAVDANTATQAELETVKGIGPALSTKILDERKKGSFKDWQDMVTRVNGVGEKNSVKFSTGGLTVNGAAFAGAPAAPATAKTSTGTKTAAATAAPKTPAAAASAALPPAAAASTAAEKKAAAKQAKAEKKAEKAAAKAAKADASASMTTASKPQLK